KFSYLHNSVIFRCSAELFTLACSWKKASAMAPLSCVLVQSPYPCPSAPIFTWDRRPSDLLVCMIFCFFVNRSHNPVMLKFRFCPQPYLQEIFVSKKKLNMPAVGLWVDYCPDITVWSCNFRGFWK